MRLSIGARVYIVGNHPWSDCAGVIVRYVYNEELEHTGALVLLDEGIAVMVWAREQLRELGKEG